MFKGRVYIPPIRTLKQTIIKEFHISPMGEHAGIHRSFKRIASNFFWPNMKVVIANYVQHCLICRQIKPINHSPHGLLPYPSLMDLSNAIWCQYVTFQNYHELMQYGTNTRRFILQILLLRKINSHM